MNIKSRALIITVLFNCLISRVLSSEIEPLVLVVNHWIAWSEAVENKSTNQIELIYL